MTQEKHPPEHLQELAEKVVKAILEDDSLADHLGDGLLVAGKKKCPKNHVCTGAFRCPSPFKCPKMHSVVPVPPTAAQ